MIAEKHSREKLIWKFISRFVEKGMRFCTWDSEFNKCLLPCGGLDKCNYKTLSDRISSENFKACFMIPILLLHLQFVSFSSLRHVSVKRDENFYSSFFIVCLKKCPCFFPSLHSLSRLFSISIFSFDWYESREFLRTKYNNFQTTAIRPLWTSVAN